MGRWTQKQNRTNKRLRERHFRAITPHQTRDFSRYYSETFPTEKIIRSINPYQIRQSIIAASLNPPVRITSVCNKFLIKAIDCEQAEHNADNYRSGRKDL